MVGEDDGLKRLPAKVGDVNINAWRSTNVWLKGIRCVDFRLVSDGDWKTVRAEGGVGEGA